MSSIVLQIKGRDWKFSLLPDKRFDKLYNSHGEGNIAMTCPTIYEVHFKKSEWDIVAIRHELLHVLFNASLVGSANLDTDDVEEVCAEIVGNHSSEIILWSDRITERFLGRE